MAKQRNQHQGYAYVGFAHGLSLQGLCQHRISVFIRLKLGYITA